jgi:hypothetical protein
MKLEFSRQIVENCSKISFNYTLSVWEEFLHLDGERERERERERQIW